MLCLFDDVTLSMDLSNTLSSCLKRVESWLGQETPKTCQLVVGTWWHYQALQLVLCKSRSIWVSIEHCSQQDPDFLLVYIVLGSSHGNPDYFFSVKQLSLSGCYRYCHGPWLPKEIRLLFCCLIRLFHSFPWSDSHGKVRKLIPWFLEKGPLRFLQWCIKHLLIIFQPNPIK